MSVSEANSLYQQGFYAAAATIYTEALQQTQDAANRSTILSNRAACALAMQDYIAAEADSRAGLALNPVSAKLRLRLAKALTAQGRLGAAAAEVAAAVALLLPEAPSADLPQLYQQLSAATPTPADAASSVHSRRGTSDGETAAADYPLPLLADPRGIVYVSTAQQLLTALSRQAAFVVLAPGTYQLPTGLDGVNSDAGCTILGLGKVVLACRTMHAVWVRSGSLTLINMQLVGSGEGAAVCVSPQPSGLAGLFGLRRMNTLDAGGASCGLIDCRVESYPEAGLLVCGKGAHATLQGCSLRRCKLHAVEIREGGSVYACNTVIEDCRQGFTAYGGARSVELYGCSILNTSKEGVLAAGSYENAATAAQREGRDSRISPFTSETHRRATEEAEAWGKQHGQQLTLVMSDCTLKGCGNFGISVDEGAAARISRCRLEACDPYCVFVKGSSDACITACQFVYGGKSSKSAWAQAYGGQALPAAGVQIGVNYAGSVQLYGNAFAGQQDRAVYSEMHDMSGKDRQRAAVIAAVNAQGMWTKPPTKAGNTYHCRADQMPSLDELSAKLPGGTHQDTTGPQSKPKQSVSAAECSRPSSTFPGAIWSPTSSQYYAIGNTAGFNVAEGAPAELPHICVLLAGCGDIRNLLATTAKLAAGAGAECEAFEAGTVKQQQQQQQQRLAFLLNDGNVSMLARNAVMLHMIIEQQAPAQAVLAVWANHALTDSQHKLLLGSCKALAEDPWPVWLSAAADIDSAAAASSNSRGSSSVNTAEAAVRSACAAWVSCTLTLQHLLQGRDTLAGAVGKYPVELSLSAVAAAIGSSDDGSSGSSGSHAVRKISKGLQKEISEYIHTGSLVMPQGSRKEPQNQPNLTMLKAPELQYEVYFSSSIFRAVQLPDLSSSTSSTSNAGGDITAGSSAAALLLRAVAPQIAAVAAAAQQGRLSVVLVPGDILTVATASSTHPLAGSEGRDGTKKGGAVLFDYIDTANVADYTSLPALLHSCAALLSPAPHARLRCESLIAYNKAKQQQPDLTHRAFAETCLGLGLTTHSALLGLELRETVALPGLQGGVRLEWGPGAAGSSGGSSTAAVAAAAGVASISLSSDGASNQAASAAMPPLSAVSLFMELNPAYKRFVESYLDPIAAASSLAGSSSSSSSSGGSNAAAVDWKSHKSPVTLAHLLAVAAPSAAGALIKALLRSAAASATTSSSGKRSSSKGGKGPTAEAVAAAGLFKWELTMHASINAGSTQSCSQVTVPTRPEYRLMPHAVPKPHPMLLALSPKPLALGTVQASQVKQLFSSFAWDEDLAVATVLLPAAVTETGPAWARYITLCALSETGLEAVSEPTELVKLGCKSVAVQPWRELPQLGRGWHWRLDCSLLESAGVWEGASRGGVEVHGDKGGWKSSVAVGGGCVVVDVRTPGPIDSAAAVEVAVTASELTVAIGTGSSGRGGSSSSSKKDVGSTSMRQKEAGPSVGAVGQVVCEGKLKVALPPGVFAKGAKLKSSTKISRAMGLLCVTVTAEMQ